MRSKEILQILGILVLFGVLFVLNSYAIYDGDYFWHVNTGHWIWENGAVPTSDPFSFTVTDSNPFRPESGRIQFILQQYWFGQLLLYFFWAMGGDGSIVVLRALAHAGLILAVFVISWKRADIYRGAILASATLCYLQNVSNERPQLFSCVFALLLVMLLERVTDRSRPLSRAAWISLPVMMLVWANTHGGYVLGLCIISAYLLALCLERRKSFDRSAVMVALLLIGSGLVSLVSPAGLPALLRELFAMQDSYQSQVLETRDTVTWILSSGFRKSLPYCFIALCTIVSLGCAFKRMRLAHVLTVMGVLALSFLAARHHVFVFLLAPLVAIYLPFPKKAKLAIPLTATLLVLLFMNTDFQKPLVFGASSRFPDDAVEFFRATKPAPNIFNYYDWGGYLSNKAPDYQVFVDGRGLVEELVTKHHEVLYGEELSVLDKYNINTAIFPFFHPLDGNVIPLVVMLVSSPDWEAVFVGRNSVIFLRDIPENSSAISSHAIGQYDMNRTIIKAYDYMLERYPDHFRALITKARSQEIVGDTFGAIKSLQRAQRIAPESRYAAETLQRLKRKINRPVPEQ